MKKLFISCCLSLLACSTVQADIVDFTAATGTTTDPNVFVTNTPTLFNVSLGNGVTADITADNSNSTANTNFTARQFNAGLGLQANGNQLNANQLIQLTFTNIMLNGGVVPSGTTVDFTLDHYLFTDPTGRGFLFDGSNNLPSALALGEDSNPNVTTNDGFILDSGSANTSEVVPANLSPLNLTFSNSVGADTYQLAPDQDVTFTNFLGVRNVNHPTLGGNTDTFFLQGFDITANVTVPEPSSSVLLGLGGLCLLARRRR